jgi:hypothetical protein
MKLLKRLFPVVLILAFASACASADLSVAPVPMKTKIDLLFIVNNPKVEIEALLPDLVNEIAAMGIPVMISEADKLPAGCINLTYDARQSGGTIKTLSYLRINVRRDGRTIGYAYTDVGVGLGRMGTTAEKLQPLLNQLFEFVRPVKR